MQLFPVLSLAVLIVTTSYCDGRPLQYQNFVTKLADDNFEHLTQASSGQTTGSWLVYFYETGERIVIQGKQPADEYWDSKHAVVGIVNSKISKETVERFQLQTKIPALLYIHRGKYYEFEGAKTWERVMEMVENPDALFQARDVPPPLTGIKRMVKKLQGPAGLPLLVVAFFVVFVRVLYWVFVEPHKRVAKKKTQ